MFAISRPRGRKVRPRFVRTVFSDSIGYKIMIMNVRRRPGVVGGPWPTGEKSAGGVRVGYARLTTDERASTAQLAALRRADCRRIYRDEASTVETNKHPALLQCLMALRPGDTLVVWKLDRLGSNVRELIQLMDDLRDRGVMFASVSESIDTSMPAGRAMWHMVGVLAALERSLIVERTRAGIRAARARGVRFGRRPKLNANEVRRARALVESGEPVPVVAKTLNVDRSTIYRLLNASREDPICVLNLAPPLRDGGTST